MTGASLWATPGTCSGSSGYTSIVKNGTFYGRTNGALNAGTLSSIRLSDQVQTWTFTGDGHLVTAPVVVNGTVFVGSSSGNVSGLEVGTGAQIWLGVSTTPIRPNSEMAAR